MKPETEILLMAADIIEHVGWCQRTRFRRNRAGNLLAACAVGAVDMALEETNPPELTRYYVIDALKASIQRRCVASWNDDPSRTRKQVYTALRKAAELAEEK